MMVEPLQTWSIGPLTISAKMLVFILSAGVGYSTMYFYLRWLKLEEKGVILDNVVTGMILSILTFKLWPFILEPSLLRLPSNLLYFSGGPFATFGAALVGFSYYSLTAYREKWSYHSIDSLCTGIIAALITYTFFLSEIGQISPFSIGYVVNNVVFHPVNFYWSGLMILLIVSSMILVPLNKKYGRSLFLITGFIIIRYLLSPFTV